MRKLTVKIWLTIAALFLNATVSAADCSSNAKECNPKQLCNAATSTEGGVKIWSKKSLHYKHVRWAKQIGVNCGVVEIVLSCDNTPHLCSEDDICKQSVQKSGGKTIWKTSSDAAKHVALAKAFGLKCGTTEVVAERKKNCSFPSLENFNGCSDLQVCKSATVGPALTKRWNPYNKNHIKEAKRRGLSCGNATGDSKTTAEKNIAIMM